MFSLEGGEGGSAESQESKDVQNRTGSEEIKVLEKERVLLGLV